jgi:hypothetical protein
MEMPSECQTNIMDDDFSMIKPTYLSFSIQCFVFILFKATEKAMLKELNKKTVVFP